MSILSLLTDVLFVGHSLISPALPPQVEAAARQQGIELRAQYQIINGAPLAYNWDRSHEAEGVDGRKVLAAGGIDAVILTEAIPLATHIRWSDPVTNAGRFYALAVGANPDAQVFLYETWHGMDSGPEASVEHDPDNRTPWRQRIDDDLPKWQGIVDGVNAARPEGGKPMRLIPAGQAMGLMADAIAAGRVAGLTAIDDLYADAVHLNDRGQVLVAMVMLAALTGQPPDAVGPRLRRTWASRDTVVTEAMAVVMREVAWRAVVAQAARETAVAVSVPEAGPAVTAAAPLAVAEPVLPPVPLSGVTNPNLALGLTGIVDWSVSQPFIDVMKTARPWIGHLPGRWGGWGDPDLRAGGWLDPQGWPRAIPPELTRISTLVLTDLPPEAEVFAGTYRVTWAGKGTLRIGGRGTPLRAAPGEAWFAFTPGEGPVSIDLLALDPTDPIRDIAVVRAEDIARFEAGEVFNPRWIDRLRGVRQVRFMDWMATNNSTLARVDDRPLADDYTYALNGAPMEVMVRLANELGADPWFTIPHLADDALIRRYAEIAAQGLAPGRVAHVEFSNEVWNWQFEQARWAEAEGQRRWGAKHTWVQAYAMRAAQMADIWTEVFGPVAAERLVRVLTVQTGWLGLEEDVLNAPRWVAEDPRANRPPYTHFDAYAVTGYFSAGLGGEGKATILRAWLAESRAAAEAEARAQGLTADAYDAFVARHRFDRATAKAAAELRDGSTTGDREGSVEHLLSETLAYHAAVARRYGLRLVMYEGGTHVVGVGALVEDAEMTAFFNHLNYTPEMAELYRQLLAGWAELTPEPFNAFVDIYRPGRWGSWGALRDLGDDNPRWRVIAGGP